MGRGIHQGTFDLIDHARTILEEIQPATVRAVCYRLFVARVINSMEKRNTQKVSRALVYAREDEMIPWDWIVDETRSVEKIPSFLDKAEFAQAAKNSFRRDYWNLQHCRIEVWSEKGTVRGTLAPVLREYAVGFQVLHGFGSATAVKLSADGSMEDERPFLVLYAGDWDCSGLHMSEVDLPDRIKRYGGEIVLRRIALTVDDDLQNLPGFSAFDKRKDPRFKWYLEHYGERCWELDALSPNLLREKVERAIRAEIDWDAWRRCEVAEKAEQESLAIVMDNWGAMYDRQYLG